jgi:hypothetical protein
MVVMSREVYEDKLFKSEIYDKRKEAEEGGVTMSS